MTLEIQNFGMVQRYDDGTAVIVRPDKNGGRPSLVEIEPSLVERYQPASGDILAGRTEPITYHAAPTVTSDECAEDAFDVEQKDEPSAVRGVNVPEWLVSRLFPAERLSSLDRINGLPLEEATDRPLPRTRRHTSERSMPERLLTLAVSPLDETGRLLDFAAPMGAGMVGVITGPHAGGLTRTLRAVIAGVSNSSPDVHVILLLLRARGEEITDWRRRFPNIDVVVCPTAQSGAPVEQTLQVADLTLECAQRQTELGRHVLLAVDSLTGLWGAMLEEERADAQSQADQAHARRRIREWVQKAGCFGGEGLLGSGLGGSLTLVGTAWDQEIDAEAEEERDLHPHLRLLEHLLQETSWRIPLSPVLARERLFPAIDTLRAMSRYEEGLLGPDLFDHLMAARRSLDALDTKARYFKIIETLEATDGFESFLAALAAPRPRLVSRLLDFTGLLGTDPTTD